ncbi:hypothetical protein HK102_003364, partial [Quaeritorhiza haematococci]
MKLSLCLLAAFIASAVAVPTGTASTSDHHLATRTEPFDPSAIDDPLNPTPLPNPHLRFCPEVCVERRTTVCKDQCIKGEITKNLNCK